MKKTLTKPCTACGTIFEKKINWSLKDWNEKRKFCGRACADKNRDFTKLKKRMTENNPAKTDRARDRMTKNNPMSHGGEVAYKRNDYKAVHTWVAKHFGTDNKQCDQCGIIDVRPRMIHWANISGKYLRNKKDWARLCYKCHKKFDFENKKF